MLHITDSVADTCSTPTSTTIVTGHCHGQTALAGSTTSNSASTLVATDAVPRSNAVPSFFVHNPDPVGSSAQSPTPCHECGIPGLLASAADSEHYFDDDVSSVASSPHDPSPSGSNGDPSADSIDFCGLRICIQFDGPLATSCLDFDLTAPSLFRPTVGSLVLLYLAHLGG